MRDTMTTTARFLVSSLLLSLSTIVSAAPISWGDATNITGVGDINTEGTIVEAKNFGNGGNTTVNGVLFNNAVIGGFNNFGGALAGNTTGNVDLNALLSSFSYGGGINSSISLANGLLNIGQQYLVQVFYTDLRTSGCSGTTSNCSNRIMTFGDDEAVENTVSLIAGGVGQNAFGQFAIGTFTANSQTLTLSTGGNFSNTHITALQVRTVPAPEIAGLFSILLGTILWVLMRRKIY